MPVPAFDPCVGPIAFLCDLTSNAAGSAQAAASDYVLGGLAHAFVAGAAQVGELALTALDATTSIDLSASWFRANVAVIAAITLPVLVGLFVVQVIGSVLRREPGGLGRAVLGVGKALIGASLALAVTQLALTGPADAHRPRPDRGFLPAVGRDALPQGRADPHRGVRPGRVRRVGVGPDPVSYTHLRAHETRHDLVCRLLLE